MVDYLVLLELPFSGQLESEYDQMKTALVEKLQNISQDQDSCQNNQCEWRLGASGGGEESGHSHYSSLLSSDRGLLCSGASPVVSPEGWEKGHRSTDN